MLASYIWSVNEKKGKRANHLTHYQAHQEQERARSGKYYHAYHVSMRARQRRYYQRKVARNLQALRDGL